MSAHRRKSENSLLGLSLRCVTEVNSSHHGQTHGVDDESLDLAIVLGSEMVRCKPAVKDSLLRLGNYDVVTDPVKQAEYRFSGTAPRTPKQCFRWDRQALQKGVESMSDDIIQPTPDTMSYVLYLKTPNDRWQSWVEVRPSTIKNAGLGLFASTQFLKDTLVTWFWGQKLEKDAPYPTDDEYHVKLEGGDIINTTPSDPFHKLLGLGAHFMNDPRWVSAEVRNSPMYVHKDTPAREVNAKFLSNGMVVTTKKIESGQEIVVDYNTGMHPRAFDKTWNDVDAERKLCPNLDSSRASRVNQILFDPQHGTLRYSALQNLSEVGRIVNLVENGPASQQPESSDLRFELKLDLTSQTACRFIKRLEIEGFINEEYDEVAELSVLLGGTVHQTLHRDVCCEDETTQHPADRDRSILLPGVVGSGGGAVGGFGLGLAKGPENNVSVIQTKPKTALAAPKLYLRHSSLSTRCRIEVIDDTLDDRYLAWFPSGLSFHGSIFHAGSVVHGKAEELKAFDKAIRDKGGRYSVKKTIAYLHRRENTADMSRVFIGVRDRNATSRVVCHGKTVTLQEKDPQDAQGNGEGQASARNRKRANNATNESTSGKKRSRPKAKTHMQTTMDEGDVPVPMDVQSQSVPVRGKRRLNPSRLARPGVNPLDIIDLVSDGDDSLSDDDTKPQAL